MTKVFVTGGCGFIGSYIVEELLRKGFLPIILDNLSPQVHGIQPVIPKELLKECLFLHADITDVSLYKTELADVNAIIHLAAETGVGQSMYEAERYTRVNVTGTACLLDLMGEALKKVEKFILVSSRAVYGEGSYHCESCGPTRAKERVIEDLRRGIWEVKCRQCGGPVTPVATAEDKPAEPVSVYGITKLAQEQLVRVACNQLGVDYAIFRCQNVYGPRQSLANPYTGLLSAFSTRIRNKLPLEVFEDGKMSRDFIHVRDVTDAIMLGLQCGELGGETFNVGTGVRTTILEVAEALRRAFDSQVEILIVGRYRIGDIRHCYADTRKFTRFAGYSARTGLMEGLSDYVRWVLGQPVPPARSEPFLDGPAVRCSDLKGEMRSRI